MAVLPLAVSLSGFQLVVVLHHPGDVITAGRAELFQSSESSSGDVSLCFVRSLRSELSVLQRKGTCLRSS
jgi:hypothetical protein